MVWAVSSGTVSRDGAVGDAWAVAGAAVMAAAMDADANVFSAHARLKINNHRVMQAFDHGLPIESNRAAVSASREARARATWTRAF